MSYKELKELITTKMEVAEISSSEDCQVLMTLKNIDKDYVYAYSEENKLEVSKPSTMFPCYAVYITKGNVTVCLQTKTFVKTETWN